jgi:hypothetical protein
MTGEEDLLYIYSCVISQCFNSSHYVVMNDIKVFLSMKQYLIQICCPLIRILWIVLSTNYSKHHWEATQMVTAAKFTTLTQKVTML